jgi:eukaryotic-like serine/threonine-protein kinase
MTPAVRRDNLRDPVDPRIDTTLDDRFRIVARLGAGGMGVVYRAVQLSIGREVALKVVRGEPDEMANERFLREARLASRLSHPAIVTTYDYGRTGSGELWIAMEPLHGRSLRSILIDDGALPLDRALAIAEQVAAALASAHAAGIVHRDVKPSNLMVLDDGSVKLLDFGLARARRCGDDASLTRSGVVCGTPAYLAPELALGAGADERSDLYGLGVILHEMLSGDHPFPAATPEAQVARMLNEAPPRLTGVPDAVAEVTQRLLARSPAERCATAAIARAWIAALRAGHTPTRRRRRKLPARRTAVALLAVATASAAFAYCQSRRAVRFRGGYASAGNPGCSRGTSWMQVDGDRVVGVAISDIGQTFELVGTYRPSGAVFGAFTLRDHPLGAFEGTLIDDRVHGITTDYVHGCTGTFELRRDD